MISPEPSTAQLARDIIAGRFEEDTVSSQLVSMSARGERCEEVLSMAAAFREAAVPVPTAHPVVADLCGTGGARVRTLNVSTAAAFVVSSLGVPVAKHGNRSNHLCGSADVLEALGARIFLSPQEAGRMLDRIGFTFLFAPSFHPAMKNAVPMRRRIGGRTVFNMLGPLLNPVRARRRQLIGVYSPALLDVLPPVLDALGVERALVVHGYPGMDEVSLTGTTKVAELRDGRVDRYIIDPVRLGITPPEGEGLSELPPARAAQALRSVLSGVAGPRRNMVALNAACALYIYGRASDLEKGLLMAERALDTGAAFRRMEEFVRLSNLGAMADA